MEKEVWKDVVGYESLFSVSNLGNIFSKRTSKELKLHYSKSGYVFVSTRIGGRKGINKCFRIHRLVAEAFLEQPNEELFEVCSKEHYGRVLVLHIDNNKSNNRVENLKWGSVKQNAEDYWKSVGYEKSACQKRGGTNSASAKLSEKDIRYIREHYLKAEEKLSFKAMGLKFKVGHWAISDIVNNRSYKYTC